MRVFVSEYAAGGGSLGSDCPDSMRREGLAMLQAVASDISQMKNCSVVTTLESGLQASVDAEVNCVTDAEHEYAVFQRLLSEVDAALVIAPETNGILADRCRRVVDAGVASWNCSPGAIELCGDKLQLANFLYWQGLPVIPTQEADFSRLPDVTSWPVVLKPRDGAGSQLTFLVRSSAEWDRALQRILTAGYAKRMIIQPYISGKSLSVGVNRSLDGQRIECLPVGEQRLSSDGMLQYLGGAIPAEISPELNAKIEEIIQIACESIPGLVGYFGVDLLVTEELSSLIVEMNPRLTTSYVGYRRLFSGVLPERWFPTENSPQFVGRTPGFVEFDLRDLLKTI